MTVLAEVGGVLAVEQDEIESPRVAKRRVRNNKLKDSLSRVVAKQSAVVDLSVLKKKAPADRSAWWGRAGADPKVLPRASLSLAENSWLAKSSGRSPGLVSQTRENRVFRRRAFPIQISGDSRRLREHHSGGTARESHPLPYSPRLSGHPKH